MEVIKASLDRFEGGFAVIYSEEEDDDNSSRKFDVPKETVAGIKAGSKVRVYLKDDGRVNNVEFDKSETEQARDRILKKYRRLKGMPD